MQVEALSTGNSTVSADPSTGGTPRSTAGGARSTAPSPGRRPESGRSTGGDGENRSRSRRGRGAQGALSVLPQRRLAGRRLARGRRGPGDPSPSLLHGVREAVHHRRGGRPRGGQAQRGPRAVQPRQGRARSGPGLSGTSGRPGRDRAAGPSGGGDGAGVGHGRGAEPRRRDG